MSLLFLGDKGVVTGERCVEGAPQSSGPMLMIYLDCLEVVVITVPKEEGRQWPGTLRVDHNTLVQCLSQSVADFPMDCCVTRGGEVTPYTKSPKSAGESYHHKQHSMY